MSVKYLKNFNFKRRLNNVEVIVQGEVEKKKIKRKKKVRKGDHFRVRNDDTFKQRMC